jgi:hypothetical protein
MLCFGHAYIFLIRAWISFRTRFLYLSTAVTRLAVNMARSNKIPPADWDPDSVEGVKERILITGFGIKKSIEFQAKITQHKWKYAGGDTKGKTKERAGQVHREARAAVWDIVDADQARLVPEDVRTEEQDDAILKVDDPWQYRKNHAGNSKGSQIIPPDATWRPDLSGEERTEVWKYAAGKNEDGSSKTAQEHKNARETFRRAALLKAIRDKQGIGLTPADLVVVQKEEVRVKKKATLDSALAKLPRTRAKKYARTRAWRKAKAALEHAELSAIFQANGVVSTEFGLGDTSHHEDTTERVHDIVHSSAGGLHPGAVKTLDNWVKDHGKYMSVEDVLSGGGWAAYFLITMRKITAGKEIKCVETTNFMTMADRNPLWRIDTTDIDTNRDLRRFTGPEAGSVVRSYLLADCVSAYDATSLEGKLQHYIEDEIDMPHGLCLHKQAGAGSRKQYSRTKVEKARLAKGEACVYSVVLSMIRVISPTFADIDPSDPDRAPPLTSCSVVSHNGKQTYNVVVRGDKQPFPDTKSVIADNAEIARKKAADKKRRAEEKAANANPSKKRKAPEPATPVDEVFENNERNEEELPSDSESSGDECDMVTGSNCEDVEM